jgi:hypothetical protein
MKINKRDNKALKKRLVAIFEEILGDADTTFMEVIYDEINPYLEDEDDNLEIIQEYFEDVAKEVYVKRAKEV